LQHVTDEIIRPLTDLKMSDIFAGFFTVPASSGTFPTMVHIMSFALFGAHPAHIGANLDQFIRETRTTNQQIGSCPANCGAIPVKPDAIYHHGQLVAFIQAGVCTVFTFYSALQKAPDQIILLHFHNFEI
jgi:hypothetical protein